MSGDDLISRAEALVGIYTLQSWHEHGRSMIDEKEAMDVLKDLPSSGMEQTPGYWEEQEVITEPIIKEWQSARCSKCGRYHTTPYMYRFDYYNYCPNCGRKMTKENEDGKDIS